MAYNDRYWGKSNVSGNSSAPRSFTYNAAAAGDNSTAVLQAGYFDDQLNLQVGDVIQVRATNGVLFLQVNQVTPTTTTSAITGGTPTTDTLQAVYANSSPADIELDAATGLISFKDNATPLGTTLFQVSNNAKSTVYWASSASKTYTGTPLFVDYSTAVSGEKFGVNGSSNLQGTLTVSGAVDFGSTLTMGATIDMDGNKVINGATPTADSDLATKGYVDSQSGNTEDLQDAYNNGSNANIGLTNAIGTFRLKDNATPISVNMFEITDSTGADIYVEVASNLFWCHLAANFSDVVSMTGQTQITDVVYNVRTISGSGHKNIEQDDPSYIIGLPGTGAQVFNLPSPLTGKQFIISNGSGSGSITVSYLSVPIITLTESQVTMVMFNGSTWDVLSGPIDTLQEVYDASSNGVTTLSSSVGTYTIRDNATPIATTLFSITNNDASQVHFSIDSANCNIRPFTAFAGGVTVNGTLTIASNMDAFNNKIVNLATPTSANDAANKAYVDAWRAPTFVYFTPDTSSEPGGTNFSFKPNEALGVPNTSNTPAFPVAVTTNPLIYWNTVSAGNAGEVALDLTDFAEGTEFIINFVNTRSGGGGTNEYIDHDTLSFRSMSSTAAATSRLYVNDPLNPLILKKVKFIINASAIFYQVIS